MRERASFASPSADRLRAGAGRRPGAGRPRDGGTRVEALAVIRLLKFDPDRVSVSFAEDTCRRIAEPDRTRRYTLTHNDLTQHLTLSVASDFNPDGQADVWYTRLLRDEVLAEWCDDGLHVHCLVGVDGHWWIAWAKQLRAIVFRQKLPLVLDTLRYAEADLLLTNPSLASAPVFVHFHEGPCRSATSARFNNSRSRASASTGGCSATRDSARSSISRDRTTRSCRGARRSRWSATCGRSESVARGPEPDPDLARSTTTAAADGAWVEAGWRRNGRARRRGGSGFAKSPGLSASGGPPERGCDEPLTNLFQ